MSYLLNRVNTITNIKYKDDPTILGWDVMNEPTLAAGFDASRGLAVGTTLRNWVSEMIGHVRAQGARQLVFAGDVRCVWCCWCWFANSGHRLGSETTLRLASPTTI